MTRLQVIKKAISGELTWIQVAEILRISGRQMRRIRKRFEAKGEAGLVDLRMGRANPRRISDEWKIKVCALYRESYYDFSALHFYEKLRTEHRIEVACYNVVKSWLQNEGLLPKNAKQSAHRKRRDRKPMKGMLLHLDGSTHAWLGPEHPNFDLLAVVDDATSEVYSALFVPQEGTRTCMQVLQETIEKEGIFCALYTDRARHFVFTKSAGEKPDRSKPSQICRALERLGTELIHAYSPEARGRGERLWRTWQGRLPQELRLNGIRTMEGANRYLREKFVPWHNRSLTVKALEPDASAFIPLPSTLQMQQIFSLQTFRQVNSDNTVQYKNQVLQIPNLAHLRFSFAGVKVTVHELLDGTYLITYGPHVLGNYNREGLLMKNQPIPKRKAA